MFKSRGEFSLVELLVGLGAGLGLAMVGAEGPPLGGRLKPRTARPPRSGGRPQKTKKLQTTCFSCFGLGLGFPLDIP